MSEDTASGFCQSYLKYIEARVNQPTHLRQHFKFHLLDRKKLCVCFQIFDEQLCIQDS